MRSLQGGLKYLVSVQTFVAEERLIGVWVGLSKYSVGVEYTGPVPENQDCSVHQILGDSNSASVFYSQPCSVASGEIRFHERCWFLFCRCQFKYFWRYFRRAGYAKLYSTQHAELVFYHEAKNFSEEKRKQDAENERKNKDSCKT